MLLFLACPCAAQAVTFTDVTLSAGIDYDQHELDPGAALGEAPYMAGGAAAADYDGDGDVDLFVTRFDARDLLYQNQLAQGGSGFVDVAEAAGIPVLDRANAAAWGDIDNDGDPDLYVASLEASRYHLFVNDGGSFTEQALVRGAALPATQDAQNGFSVSFADVNGDGYLDIQTTEWRVGPINQIMKTRLLLNAGAAAPGHFSDVTDAAGLTVELLDPAPRYAFTPTWHDFDADGHIDLALASDFYSSHLFWNDGDGTFTVGSRAAGIGTEENGMGSAVADYDLDGDFDWFVTSIYDPAMTCFTVECGWGYSGNRLYRNNGDRTFTDQTDAAGVRDGGWGWGATFFDHDNDGDPDLVMVNGVDFPGQPAAAPFVDDVMRFWDNDGAGNFTELGALTGLTDTGSGKGVLSFDYDGDGDLDLFITNNGANGRLYRNEGGNGNDWLRVRCVGVRPCHGARVEVIATDGAPVQVQYFNGNSNFLSHNEPVLHFGLGTGAGGVHRLTIIWPNGLVQARSAITANMTFDAFRALDLTGDDGANVLAGDGGDDRLDGRGGDDVLSGGDGNDELSTGAGTDGADGGAGDDLLRVGAGANEVRGGAGDDVIVVDGSGIDAFTDTLSGGTGNDVLDLALSADQLADDVVQAELAMLREHIASTLDPDSAGGNALALPALGIVVETVEVLRVNGQTMAAPTGTAESHRIPLPAGALALLGGLLAAWGVRRA
ncbi:MAG: CRTAC1 family protein [Gammaproteobacteria bacterium]